MKYNSQQVDHLAAEYVLGTLQSSARPRFERLMTERADARFAVWRWERCLNAFTSRLAPREPAPYVWKSIQRRVGAVQHTPERSRGWLRGLWLAVPAAAVAAWLAIVVVPAPGVDRVAIFTNSDAETLWVISTDFDDGSMRVKTIKSPPLASTNSFELWVLPDSGRPLSLGVLDLESGSATRRIEGALATALEHAGGLAISLEPVGGSPTDLPTGPIVFQASLVSI